MFFIYIEGFEHAPVHLFACIFATSATMATTKIIEDKLPSPNITSLTTDLSFIKLPSVLINIVFPQRLPNHQPTPFFCQDPSQNEFFPEDFEEVRYTEPQGSPVDSQAAASSSDYNPYQLFPESEWTALSGTCYLRLKNGIERGP